jgi:NAD(P)-dependent dehydrogenase (short-subunit alcohol dehydrogenase family)
LKDLENRVAVITGGASGIGFGMAQAFLEKGMKVAITDVRKDHLETAEKKLEGAENVRFYPLDVTDRTMMQDVADQIEIDFGKIHVLCNNAGVGIMGPVKEMSYDDWDWSMRVNLDGVFNGIHTYLPKILKHGDGGHIVNTASVGAALPANIAYASAKCAVLGMSECIRSELAEDNIGVTCLLPGPTATNINEVAELRPKEFSNTKLHAFEEELSSRKARDTWLDPLLAGDLVVDAISRNLLFVFTHAEHKAGTAKRFEAILAGFPDYEVGDDAAERLGFRIANPMYDEILLANEPPARHRKSK